MDYMSNFWILQLAIFKNLKMSKRASVIRLKNFQPECPRHTRSVKINLMVLKWRTMFNPKIWSTLIYTRCGSILVHKSLTLQIWIAWALSINWWKHVLITTEMRAFWSLNSQRIKVTKLISWRLKRLPQIISSLNVQFVINASQNTRTWMFRRILSMFV